jgi:hypothetical protein
MRRTKMSLTKKQREGLIEETVRIHKIADEQFDIEMVKDGEDPKDESLGELREFWREAFWQGYVVAVFERVKAKNEEDEDVN